jgi:hypothetical protein
MNCTNSCNNPLKFSMCLFLYCVVFTSVDWQHGSFSYCRCVYNTCRCVQIQYHTVLYCTEISDTEISTVNLEVNFACFCYQMTDTSRQITRIEFLPALGLLSLRLMYSYPSNVVSDDSFVLLSSRRQINR